MKAHVTDAELVGYLKLIKQHEGNLTKAGAVAGINRSQLSGYKSVAKARGLTAESKVIDAEARLRQEIKIKDKRIEKLIREEETAETIRTEIYNLAARTPEPPTWLVKDGKAGSRGAPMTMWSDFHFGEVVSEDETGGVNKYNQTIAKARLKTLVSTTIDLAYNHMGRAKTQYPGIVICLGGDMIGGDIHEELAKTNDRTTQQGINDLTDMLGAGIETMATKFGRAFIPCVVGNHGRSTKKMQMKQRVFCVATDTPILTRDLRWVPAGELHLGSSLLAFEEKGSRQGRRFQDAEVTYFAKKQTTLIRLSLADGSSIAVTPDHKLLGHGGQDNSRVKWITAEQFLQQGLSTRRNKVAWTVDRFFPVWSEDMSYTAGLLSGAFDSEGCLSRTNGTLQLSFNQVQNVFLDRVKEAINSLGFSWGESWDTKDGHKPRCAVYIKGGLTEILRFLGTVRPVRLLQKWAEFDATTAFMYKRSSVEVMAATVETGEIAEISSSTKTYISAGYGSHNTSHEWNIYCNLERYFRGSKHIQFMIPSEADAFFNVYGHRFMLSHGDSLGVKGGDGIIGALGPIMRGSLKTHRSEAAIERDFDTLLIGHWHQYLTLPGLIVNNALKGYDEYARLALRAPYSRPSQALWFIHPEHGITAHWQVYLEKLRTATDAKAWVKILEAR